MWVDIDFKDTPKSEADDLILGFDIQPSAIVGTGGGYHCYWFLEPPIPGADEILEVESILRGLKNALKGDEKATDASRILRAPGSLNVKYDPPPKVLVLALKSAYYSFSSFFAYKETNNISYIKRATTMPDMGDASRFFKEGRRDADLFHAANCLTRGGGEPNLTEYILTVLATYVCKPPFPPEQVPIKVQSALNIKNRSEKSLMQEIREVIAVSESFIKVSDVLQMVSKVSCNRKAVQVALHRLSKEGVITKCNLPGCYAIVEKYKDAVHIDDVGEGAYFDNIVLPMGLNRYVRLSPGNMVLVGGMTNSGKTGVVLNFIRDNMQNHKCLYVTTEASKEMTKERIRMFDDQLKWNFEIIDDWDEKGVSVIRPDDITLIDWLQAPKDAFELASRLNELHQKVDKGLLVVALQKNPGIMYPFGGYQTISKSSLYLAMDLDGSETVMTVGKAKAWASRENPHQMQCRFRFDRSVNIVMVEPWMPEYLKDEKKLSSLCKPSKAKKSF